ncbi:hypothetical protein Bealeia2_02070 (plasmid) [Candidatus Bealeia paramacronuclearis]|uniref:hypothetical protein n=1 Tax=Candidatus Bealeia paramacronuclearis TaxID=1921001 RepID=UPI002B90BAFD|nr:hypothetical protein [Candidatus Bealeia paramacronuclearis]
MPKPLPNRAFHCRNPYVPVGTGRYSKRLKECPDLEILLVSNPEFRESAIDDFSARSDTGAEDAKADVLRALSSLFFWKPLPLHEF